MQAFTGAFALPRLERVVAGPGTLDALGGELERYGCTRAVIVTGRTVAASSLLDRVKAVLAGRLLFLFDEARQHVPSDTVEVLTARIRHTRADCLVSLGGGSPIDTAKGAVHALLTGRRTCAEDRLPVHVALPTTLSAGEFTDVAGITDETRVKRAVSDPRLAPRTVIADPVLTLQTPPWLWAASGIRALDHAVECLYSSRVHPVTEPLATRAIEMLLDHLPASLGGGEEALAHRGACQMAAWLAVFGVTNAGFGLSHVLGHQIGPRWNVAHGVTSAIVLPHAMRFMADAAPTRFAPIAEALGVPFPADAQGRAAHACADRVAEFIAQFDLPVRLRDVGVPRRELEEVAGLVAGLMDRAEAVGHPVGRDELARLLAAAY